MEEKPHVPDNLTDYPLGALAYRDLERSFFTFFQRNARLKKSLSWRMTLPVRRISYYGRPWLSYIFGLPLAVQHGYALFQHEKSRNPLKLWRLFRQKGRQPAHIDLAYHKWRKNHPLPRLHDDEIIPRTLLVLISPEVLCSTAYPECLESIKAQRGCKVDILSLSSPLPFLPGPYDAILWLKTATRLTPDYGQIACRALSEGMTLFYADHDTQLSSILYERPFFKPTFSPELLRHVDYLEAGCAFSPSWLAQQKKWQNSVNDTYLHEKFTDLTPSEVRHMPLCLSHLLALRPARTPVASPSQMTLPPSLIDQKITLIIPTAFYGTFLKTLLESLFRTTEKYRNNIDVIIITNNEKKQAEAALKDAPMPYRIIYYDHDFNYSTVNNEAVRQSNGDILIFLNDDIELQDNYWLPDMLSLLRRPKTGAVGCLLLYPDHTIQHAGCLIGMNGGVGHVGVGLPFNTDSYHNVLTAQREISAVTGACLAIRRDVFLKAGMFDERLPLSFNDIALCLRLREMGYTHYITTRSRIIHHESRSRGYETTAFHYQNNREHFLYARTHYSGFREADPYYNPNLDLSSLYKNYAPLSPVQQSQLLRPASSGYLILLSQRMDYDLSTQPLIAMLTRYKTRKMPVRLVLIGTEKTRFFRQCCAVSGPENITLEHPRNIRDILLNAQEHTRLIDLRLINIMGNIPPSLSLIGVWIENGVPCFTDLSGCQLLKEHAFELN